MPTSNAVPHLFAPDSSGHRGGDAPTSHNPFFDSAHGHSAAHFEPESHGHAGGCDHGHADGGGLHWGPSEWADAGGFDAVLFGHLSDLVGGQLGGHDPIVVIPIEHLEINSITQIENTEVLLNAANGGSISIGGSVSALASQGLPGLDGGHDAGLPHGTSGAHPVDFGSDSTLASNDVTLLAGNGLGNTIGGNVTAIADQAIPDHHFA